MNRAALQLMLAREFTAASGADAVKRVTAVARVCAMAYWRCYKREAELYAATLSS